MGQTRAALGAAVALLALWSCDPTSARDGSAPLVLERTILLPGVSGRIDHVVVDAAKGRLFVAELGNGSVEAIDLASGRSLGRIAGLKEPQSLGYLPARDELAVATGGDGMVRFYRAADLALVGSIPLGDDADNVRVDPKSGMVVVGYGGGALAVIDPAVRKVVRKIPLPAHPEGFQLAGDRVWINLPDAGLVLAADLATGRETARWPNGGPKFNFPLALESSAQRFAVVYRLPAKLVLRDAASGAVQQSLDTCGDADDAFFDDARHRLYVICGGGAVDVFDDRRTGFIHVGRVATRRGARTGFYSSKLDRLFVAARAGPLSQSAAILVLRPAP